MSFDLNRALEDLADAGASRRSTDDDALTARVGLMASRIRRRRAVRYTGTTVVAACAVGALALGVAYLPGLVADRQPGPAAPSSAAPSPSESQEPETTLAPLTLTETCGVPIGELEQAGQLRYFAQTGESDIPQTADGGFTEVLSVMETADQAEAEIRYAFPGGAQLQEIEWTLLVTDADGTVIAFQQSPLTRAVAPEGVTSSEVNMTLPGSLCASFDDLPAATYDLYAVAEAHGILASGSPYLERAVSDAYPVELGGIAPGTDDPFGGVFTCDAPGPESIHTLPDDGGLTLAVDLPAGPWSAAALPQIPGFVGAAGGQTIIANLALGVSGALVGPDGTVVGFVLPDASDVSLAELVPDATTEVVTDQVLVMCGADGSLGSTTELEGTFTLWPFVTAVLKEVTDAEGNATTPSSDPVIVIANPQQVTFGEG